MKFLELFSPIKKGDFGLTEEAVYKSIQLGSDLIPLWGGNQSHVYAERFVNIKAKTKYSKPITVFQGKGIIISLDGSAGNMTYKNGPVFALNHHAGFFKVKKEAVNLIDIEFFSIFYKEQLKEASISDGSKTLTLDKIYSMDFDIPSKINQIELMQYLKPTLYKIEKLQSLLLKSELLLTKALSYSYKKFQIKQIPISDVLSYIGGNSGLTEEEIYQKVLLNGSKYKILSGATSPDTQLGYVSMFNLNDIPIKVFENKEGILIVRKGKAGYSFFLEKGKYTLTDDAYILYVKDDCKFEVSTQWLHIQYSNFFYDYSSSSDNGTWNMTNFFNNMIIDIPVLQEQLLIVKQYTELYSLRSKLLNFNKRTGGLFTKILSEV